jgi:hypothetical protein
MGVLTAPLALIRVQTPNGLFTIGKMKNIRVNESIQRGKVMGIGVLTPDELPALAWDGTLSCSFYLVEFKKQAIEGALQRTVQSLEEFVDTVILNEVGVQVDLLRKVAAGPPDPITGIIQSTLQEFASITGVFITRESFDVTENAISGRDSEFQYLKPVMYK